MVGRRILLLGLCALAFGCAVRAVPAGDATVAARQYVIEHRAQLEREIEIGSGEGLYELSKIADCRDLPQLGRTLHKKQAEIFPVPPPSDPIVADRIVELLKERSELVCLDFELGPTRLFKAGRRHVWAGA